jgi:nitrate reductase beta subunit
MGVLLYDADRIPDAMKVPNHALVESQRSALLDPHDARVVTAARRNGISEEFITAAQDSPVWKYVGVWKLALPLHVEYRTMPMLFYVPPLLPIMGRSANGVYENAGDAFFSDLERARVPIAYLASLFSAGNTEIVEGVMKKLMAVRYFKRAEELDDVDPEVAHRVLREAGLTPDAAEAIYRMTATATIHDRYVLPPIQREEALEGTCGPEACKGETGLGFVQLARRGA